MHSSGFNQKLTDPEDADTFQRLASRSTFTLELQACMYIYIYEIYICICTHTLLRIHMEVERDPLEDYYPLYRAFQGLPC